MPSRVPQEFSEISAEGLDFAARSRSSPSFEARLRPGWAHHVPEPHISGRSAAPGIATDPHGSPRSSPTRCARDRPVEQRAGQSSRPRPPDRFVPNAKADPGVRRLGSRVRGCPGVCIRTARLPASFAAVEVLPGLEPVYPPLPGKRPLGSSIRGRFSASCDQSAVTLARAQRR